MRQRDSLRMRLAFLICVLIVVVVATFLWVAYREVEQTLLRAGGTRAQVAADSLANLLAQSAQQRLAEARRVAATTEVRRLLLAPTNHARAAAVQMLSPFAAAGQPPIEIWNHAGHLVVSIPGSPASGVIAGSLPAKPPLSSGVSAFQVSGTTLFYEAVADVSEGAGRASEAAGSPSAGYVRVRRVLGGGSTADVISRLVGDGAVVLIGNQTDGTWSDLARAVPAPPVPLKQMGIHTYRAGSGDDRLGAIAPIRSTPWAVWVEFPRSVVVSPAWTFATRMFLFGLCFVATAALAARMVSARITTPLHQLTHAAEAIAGGNYSERVATNRTDEIGRLGLAFNSMAERVEESHRHLEARVKSRLEEVKAARAELDTFFSLSLDLMCIAGIDGYFKRVNPAWRDVLGWTEAELTSRPYEAFVHPDDRDATSVEQANLAEGRATLAFENRYRHKDGTYRWLQWKAVPDPQHGVIYAAARDITVQKRAEQAMLEHADALAAANQELESFSYSVSHDLRAPLRHITGFAALLQQRVGASLDPQATRYLTTMIEAAGRMGRLIDDLLTFSRMSRASLTKQRVSLGPLLADVRREVESGAEHRDIIWTVHDLPDVEADPAMLRLAFVNLLGNAVKYTGTRPQAHIEVGTSGDDPRETVFVVRDNGVGFDMQYAHKLFGVFQRLHGSDQFEGTGIGLANVRRIVQRHGGRVWAESEIDRGAAFYMALPKESVRSDAVDRAPLDVEGQAHA